MKEIEVLAAYLEEDINTIEEVDESLFCDESGNEYYVFTILDFRTYVTVKLTPQMREEALSYLWWLVRNNKFCDYFILDEYLLGEDCMYDKTEYFLETEPRIPFTFEEDDYLIFKKL